MTSYIRGCYSQNVNILINNGGSFGSMNFVKKTNGVTSESAYQCYKSFTIMGKETKEFSVKAKAVNKKAKGKAYMGVGKGHFGYDYSFTVNATK